MLWAIAVLLAFCLPAQGELLLTLPTNTSMRSGGSGSLGIILTDTDIPSPTGIQWTLSYSADQVVSIQVTPGPAATAADKSVKCADHTETMVCIVYGMNSSPIHSGTLVILNVQLRSGLADSSSVLQLKSPIATSSQGDELPIAATGGSVAIIREPSPAGEWRFEKPSAGIPIQLMNSVRTP